MDKTNTCYGCYHGMCNVLYEGECKGQNPNCKFRATKEEIKASQINALKIIASRSLDVQKRISDKYYDGKMPWDNL